ncbi:FecR family protein [Flavobacterium psychrotolerans]|uniref:Iron dicitrate transport regulator FecR n=1 Tax=Flavobacterium psychrotolerans TaxID=2169410 RepID=A0A2U1JPZ2_9FLAO|nr:FecR family protein [Flavobacterium psychrotolerans]PWA07250.1 iron dicitrate transport regulator FecR [Flavobacterium psychrotolerans]
MEEKYELAKWLAGEMSDEELINFQNTKEYTTYARIKQYSNELEAPPFDEKKLYESIIKRQNKKGNVISMYKNWVFKIAAVLIIGLGVIFVMQNFTTQTQSAGNGKKTTFTLPDYSEVVLNAGSEIEYKKWNWDNNRKLELNGEAYFRVAKGKRFEVATNLGKVTVLGTQFNVKARKNRFDVTCFEGRVKVNYKDKEILLTYGQSVTFENERQIDSKIDVSKPEWLENKIAFNTENLQRIIDEIERQYDVSIEVKPNYSDELFTGKIPTDDLNVALKIIATTYHFEIKKIGTNKIYLEGK